MWYHLTVDYSRRLPRPNDNGVEWPNRVTTHATVEVYQLFPESGYLRSSIPSPKNWYWRKLKVLLDEQPQSRSLYRKKMYHRLKF